MLVNVVAAVVFAAASLVCAHRLRYAARAREYVVCTPFVVGAWVALLWSRQPTAGSMVLNFLLLDSTIMLLACLGVFRMLGAFDADPWGGHDIGGGGDDGRGDDGPHDPVSPVAPGDSLAPLPLRIDVRARRPRGIPPTRRRRRPAATPPA
ncbi:MAG: hypothetical protein JWN41_1299 [Thermoleophilia bacterium]|nr:hypothetical protein [Thermoleophilia bacterium]